jgi:hypothetical protein
MTCWYIRLGISAHESISSNDETDGGKIDGTDQEPLLWQLFAAACSLPVDQNTMCPHFHRQVLEAD